MTPLLLINSSLQAQGLITHHFNDGDMGPFVHCTTQNPNYAKVVNNRLRTYWKESSYNSNNRMTKGAEACGDPVHNGVGYLTYKHCWMGFIMNIDEDYMGPNFTGVGSLAQIFGFDHARGQSTWTAMLLIEDGDLMWVDRRGSGKTRAEVVVYENFPRGEDVAIIIHAVLSDNNTGEVELFVNDNLEYSAYNIRIGMGEFDNNDTQTNESSTEFKIGQYNHSGAANNEIRIVDYDNMSWYDGVDGYDIVNPNTVVVEGCDHQDAFSRIEAEDYCDQLGIKHQGNDIGNIANGDWIQFDAINFGNGANACEARVASNTAGGKIEIRLDSASGTLIGTLDVANTGGWNSWETISGELTNSIGTKKVYFVFKGSSSALFDVDWIKFSKNNSLSTYDFNTIAAAKVKSFPNPIAEQLHLQIDHEFITPLDVQLLNLKGQVLYSEKVIHKNHTIMDMSIMPSGFYILQFSDGSQTVIRKVVKQ